MVRGSTHFLRFVISIICLAVLALCIFALPSIWKNGPLEFPGIENILYPSLIGIGLTTIPFFAAVFETWKLLRNIDKNIAFSESSVHSLRRIKQYGFVIFAFYALSIMPLFFVVADKDDAPGLVILGAIFTGAPIVVSVFAATLQKLLQNALDLKSENDLTV